MCQTQTSRLLGAGFERWSIAGARIGLATPRLLTNLIDLVRSTDGRALRRSPDWIQTSRPISAGGATGVSITGTATAAANGVRKCDDAPQQRTLVSAVGPKEACGQMDLNDSDRHQRKCDACWKRCCRTLSNSTYSVQVCPPANRSARIASHLLKRDSEQPIHRKQREQPMQFHLNGFRTGNPEVTEPAGQRVANPGTISEEADVLIVGCGPAGLTLAAQLAAFPEIKTTIIEQKSGPLLLGQADGIACRTIEMFEAFGFSGRVLKESHWVNETSFWKPDDSQRDRIVRSGRIQDVEDGLSEFPHVILNQARVHDFYLDVMRNAPTRLEPFYARKLLDLDIAKNRSTAHPVTVRLERLDPRVCGAGGNRTGALRRRLRWRTQHGPEVARSGAARGFGEPGLGRHGRACRYGLSRHPLEGGDPFGKRRQHARHSARGRLSRPPVYRTRQAQRKRAGHRAKHHHRAPHRRGAAHPASLYAGGDR